jgi:hypothetical protein
VGDVGDVGIASDFPFFPFFRFVPVLPAGNSVGGVPGALAVRGTLSVWTGELGDREFAGLAAMASERGWAGLIGSRDCGWQRTQLACAFSSAVVSLKWLEFASASLQNTVLLSPQSVLAKKSPCPANRF